MRRESENLAAKHRGFVEREMRRFNRQRNARARERIAREVRAIARTFGICPTSESAEYLSCDNRSRFKPVFHAQTDAGNVNDPPMPYGRSRKLLSHLAHNRRYSI